MYFYFEKNFDFKNDFSAKFDDYKRNCMTKLIESEIEIKNGTLERTRFNSLLNFNLMQFRNKKN